MYARHWWQLAAIAASMGIAGSVFAADAGTTTSQAQTSPSAAGSVQGYLPEGPPSVGGSERIDNSNPVPLDAWAREYAQLHGGRLPPVVYVVPNEAHTVYYIPEHAPATYVSPDSSVTTFVVPRDAPLTYTIPGDARVIYVLPGGISINDDTAVPGPGGMQVTPGADGPSSPKGE